MFVQLLAWIYECIVKYTYASMQTETVRLFEASVMMLNPMHMFLCELIYLCIHFCSEGVTDVTHTHIHLLSLSGTPPPHPHCIIRDLCNAPVIRLN